MRMIETYISELDSILHQVYSNFSEIYFTEEELNDIYKSFSRKEKELVANKNGVSDLLA